MDQAAPEDQDVPGRERKRGTHPAADGVDRLPAGGHPQGRRGAQGQPVGDPHRATHGPVPARAAGARPMATTATPTSRLRRPSTGAVCMSHAACHCHSVYQPLGLSSLTVRAEPVEASHLHSHALRQAQGERKFHRGRPFVFVSPDQFIPDTSARRRESRPWPSVATARHAGHCSLLDSRLRGNDES